MKSQALVFLLALVVRAVNRRAQYDSDDEHLGGPRQQIREPFISRDSAPATGAPIAGALDQHPSRNEAWSSRMREKVQLFFYISLFELFLFFFLPK